MAARTVDIAAAVVTDLAAATFSQTVSVSRVWRPRAELLALATTIKVLVMPAGDACGFDGGSRISTQHDFMIDVAVRKKLAGPTETEENTEIDGLAALAEEVGYFYHPETHATRHPVGRPEVWMATEWLPLFNPELMESERIFLAVARMTFRGWKN